MPLPPSLVRRPTPERCPPERGFPASAECILSAKTRPRRRSTRWWCRRSCHSATNTDKLLCHNWLHCELAESFDVSLSTNLIMVLPLNLNHCDGIITMATLSIASLKCWRYLGTVRSVMDKQFCSVSPRRRSF